MQVGDKVISVYGIQWNDLFHHWNILSIKEVWASSIPLEIEREGVIKTFHIARRSPTLAFQLLKTRFIVLSMLCWLTGYTISTIRRHEAVGSSVVPFFWFITSFICGIYIFTAGASQPLYTITMWVVVTVLAPLIVYVHIWFPPRHVSAEFIRKARKTLVTSIIAFNIILAAYVFAIGLTLAEVINFLIDTLAPIAFCLCLILSSILLYRAYKGSIIAHTRRQIRIITISFALVVIARLFLLLISDVIKLEIVALEDANVIITMLIPLSFFLLASFRTLKTLTDWQFVFLPFCFLSLALSYLY